MAPEDGWFLLSEKPRKIRARWAPEPAAEIEVTAGKWQTTIPDGRIVWTEADLQADPRRSTPLAAEVPAPIAARIGRFPSHQWALGVLLHHQPLVGDLADANPALAYALANNHMLRHTKESTSLDHALHHARRKQRELLEWLGFPASEAAVRLFRKLTPEEVDPYILLRLRSTLARHADTLPLLAHHPRVTAEMVELVTHGHLRPFITQKLLAEVASASDREVAGMVGDTLLVALCLMERLRPRPAVRPLESIAGVNRFLQQVERENAAQQAAAERAKAPKRKKAAAKPHRPPALPAPPIPGTETIIPLTTPEQLKKEGAEMRHCAGALVPMVRAGQIYCYQVLSPDRATLAITPAPGGHWRVFDLKCFQNTLVRRETRLAVMAWLDQQLSA